MIEKLIKRPVAVTMTIIAILILGSVAIGLLPVSLMPNVAIPQITIQLQMNGASAKEVDASLIKPIRSQLIQISTISELKCEAVNEGGTIFIQFEHGSNIDFNFIEVNEKIDRALQNLPKDIERPKIIKASATDIPVFFIDITPKENNSVENFIELSRFAKEVLAKRIEQVEQVALVDISGVQNAQILIEPYNEKLTALGITTSELESAIRNNNISLGNLTIKDGYYQWNVRFDSEILKKEDIENITLNINNRIFRFTELANVTMLPGNTKGLVRLDNKRAVTFAVIKQNDARMSDLKTSLDDIITNFNKEYPSLDFSVSRNQTELLDYSISNLKNNIILGAILAVLVIFLFLKDFRSPLLVIITIPLSLIVSLLFLYLLGITINIISLSGLILGIGMMVDNSIIVIDNITQRWERDKDLDSAIAKGTNEVIAPMLSSVLTTCSVFIPLIFLSGIAGALFYDQAMGVTVALLSSFFVAILVIPVYFRLFYRNKSVKEQSKFLNKIQIIDYVAVYERCLKWLFRRQVLAWTIFVALIPLTILCYSLNNKSKLPYLTHDDIVLNISWNEPIDINENDRRGVEIIELVKNNIESSNILTGKQDFILSHTQDIDSDGAMVYIKCKDANDLPVVEQMISEYIINNYPHATHNFTQTANIFNLIFADNEAPLVAMIKGRNGEVPEPDMLNAILENIKSELPDLYIEPVLWQEQILFIADPLMMAMYNVDYNSIYQVLSRATKESAVMSIKQGTFSVPIIIGDNGADNLLALTVKNKDNVEVPLGTLLKERKTRDLKNIISGKDGDYYPLNILAPDKDIPNITAKSDNLAKRNGNFNVSFAGAYFS